VIDLGGLAMPPIYHKLMVASSTAERPTLSGGGRPTTSL
jgi:hypothetical protein